jgi:hypothetical protein
MLWPRIQLNAHLNLQDKLFQKLLADTQEALEVFSVESRLLQEMIEQAGSAISLGEYNILIGQRVRSTHAIERYISHRKELFARLKLTHRKQTELQPSDSLR